MSQKLTRQAAIENNILSGMLPTLANVRHFLRYNAHVAYRVKVLDAFIIGSVAKGTDHKDSALSCTLHL